MNRNHWQQLPYVTDSAELMHCIASLDRPVFLDSSNSSSPQGRYDVLTALPEAYLQLDNGLIKSSQTLSDLNPRQFFPLLQQLLDLYSPGETEFPVNIPFQGGALGVIGYPRLLANGNMEIINAAIGIYLWAIVVDHQTRHSYLFFLENCPVETRNKVFFSLGSGPQTASKFNLLRNFSHDDSRHSYTQAFDAIMAFIRAGDCYQVNLTQRFSSEYQGDPFVAYLKLRNKSENPFSAYLRWNDKALLCVSPERFIQARGNQVTTQPIKGTRPRGRSAEEDQALANALLNSDKDRAENLMIVDLLRNDIGKLCDYGSVTGSKLFELQSFNNVHHLISTVQGRLKQGCNSIDLLSSCFPGGSVTGAPKIRAMQIIAQLESHARDYYCGSVVSLGFNGEMDSNITIRSLFCEGDAIYCWAGSGIVDGSECDSEYQECFDKINILINTLQNSP